MPIRQWHKQTLALQMLVTKSSGRGGSHAVGEGRESNKAGVGGEREGVGEEAEPR